MAEIKSTLDLIMEKTKGLTMSPQEKEEIRREEWLKKAKGLIQKFLDDRVDMDKVKSELLSKEYPSEWGEFLKVELINGLEPEGGNEKRLQLINELLKIPSEPFIKILKDFDQKVLQEKAGQMDHLKKQLSVQGISGPAVIPNVDRDPAWRRFYNQEKKACKEKILGL
jgi:hypothetical protein